MIDDLTIQRVKDSAKILDVVSDYVTLKRNGNQCEYTGRCPFHDDRHAGSFTVNTKKNFAHCFPCDKTWDPIAFIQDIEKVDFIDAIRILAKKFGVYIDESGETPPQKAEPRPLPPPLPKRTWPLEWVGRYMADGSDNFVRWIYGLPWDGAQKARIKGTLEGYAVGHSHFKDDYGQPHDFTMFWQIDENYTVHNAHFMKYGNDGKRIKEKEQYPMTWLHARMKRAKKNPFNEDNEDKSFCLFGQHLINSNPNAVVNIVESEKTAIIMTIAYGCTTRQIWMACCGIGNLTNSHNLLRPLIEKGKRIVLYPDHDGVDAWRMAAKQINYKNLSVETRHVSKWWLPEDGEKADIADIILRSMNEHHIEKPTQIGKPIDEWCMKNQNVKTLIEKLNLEPI